MRTTDSGFEHSAAPDRHSVLGGECLNGSGLCEPADTAELDVDYPARRKLVTFNV
jgi:hypothetical protein